MKVPRWTGRTAGRCLEHYAAQHFAHGVLFLLVINILQAFQAFGPINIMTGGGPSGATDVLSYSIYRDAFVNYQFSPAAAKSVLLFLILLGVTVFQMKTRKEGDQ